MTAAKESKKGSPDRVTFGVSTASRPDFESELVAHVFDANDQLLETARVKSGKVELQLSKQDVRSARVFFAPSTEGLDVDSLTPAKLKRLGAYEPILRPGKEGLVDRIVLLDTLRNPPIPRPRPQPQALPRPLFRFENVGSSSRNTTARTSISSYTTSSAYPPH